MQLMLSTTPVMREGNSGLQLRDLVVEVSRWVLSANDNPTVTINRSHKRSTQNSQRKEEAAPPGWKRRPSSLASASFDPEWVYTVVLMERPAHLRLEWGDLSYDSLPTPP